MVVREGPTPAVWVPPLSSAVAGGAAGPWDPAPCSTHGWHAWQAMQARGQESTRNYSPMLARGAWWMTTEVTAFAGQVECWFIRKISRLVQQQQQQQRFGSLTRAGSMAEACEKCQEAQLAFNASYTIPTVQRAMVTAFTGLGLRRSLARDKTCMVQWAPFTKIAWKRVLEGQLGRQVFAGFRVSLFTVCVALCWTHLVPVLVVVRRTRIIDCQLLLHTRWLGQQKTSPRHAVHTKGTRARGLWQLCRR